MTISKMASTNTSNKSAILNKQYQTYELSQDKITVHFQNFQKKNALPKTAVAYIQICKGDGLVLVLLWSRFSLFC